MYLKISAVQAKKWVLFFSCLIFSIGALSRDVRLHNLLVNYTSDKEFKVSNLLCGELTRCTRIGGELLGLGVQNFFYYVAKLFHGNPLWQNFYLTDKQFFSIFSGFSSIAFRVICLLPIMLYFNKLLKENIIAKILTTLAFTSIFSGFPLYYLNNLFGIYLVNYDYMVIFVIGLFLNFYDQILKSNILLVFFTMLSTITMENLGLVLIFVVYFLNKQSYQRIKLLFLIGLSTLFTYLILFAAVVLKNGFIPDNQSDGRYGNLNREKLPEILGAMAIIVFWSFALGYLVGQIGFMSFSTSELKTVYDDISSSKLYGLIVGFLFCFLVGLFVSITTEFARQFLPLQFIVFFFGLSNRINRLLNLKKAL